MDTHNQESVEEYLAKIRETVRKSRELVALAKEKLAETDRLYQEAGLTREQVKEMLESPDLPPELRKKLDEMRDEWEHEVEALGGPAITPDQEMEHRKEQLGAFRHNLRI